MEGKLQNPCKRIAYADRTYTKQPLEMTGVVRSVILIRVALLLLHVLSGVVVTNCLKMWRVLFYAYMGSGTAAGAVVGQAGSGRWRLPSSARDPVLTCSRCCSI